MVDRPKEEKAEGSDANDDTYEPSMPQVNRARVQGTGVGQKDIDYQRDPTRARSADQYGDKK